LWVNGHVNSSNFIAMAAARACSIPVFMRCETHLGLAASAVKIALRRPLLSMLYRQCDALLAIGSANTAFYRAMGVPQSKIHLAPYAIDNARFMRDARITDDERRVVRRRYG